MRRPIRLSLASLMALAATGLAACGSSSTGLIPAQNAGPLQNDFEAVAQAAQAGDGNCAATDEALAKTEQDFATLPLTVDAGLHKTLQVGITNLAARARAACAQPLASTTTTGAPTTSTTTSSSTTTTTTTPTSTSSTETSSTATTTPPITTTTPGVGGGTQAPPGESDGAPGNPNNGQGGAQGGAGVGENGAGVGGAGAGSGQGSGK